MLTNNLIQLLIILGSLTIIVIFLVACGMSVFKHLKRLEYIKKFSDYRAVLEYHLEKAYDMIHKEHILAYSLDAFRIDDEDYDKISKEFVRLVEKFIGPVLLKEFVYLYGDESTFVFNLLEYFSTKYESDEIRNTALEQITDTEIDEKT